MAVSPNENRMNLPEFDENARMQEQSVRALNALLKHENQFLLRDERHQDYGVDAVLELLIDRYVTNFRAQVQIKAVSSTNRHKDGSISKTVKVSNLVYLLNGSSSLYILYECTTDTFWYAWASDEARRLDEVSPKWQEQQSVALHFKREMNAEALGQIHSRILSERKLHREIQDVLAAAIPNENIRVEIDTRTLETTNACEAYSLIRENGFTFVTNGFAEQIIRLSGILTSLQKEIPEVSVTLAYACFSQGSFYEARGLLGRALIDPSLSSDFRGVAEEMKDGCDCHLGRLTLTDLQTRITARVAKASGSMRLLHRIDALRLSILRMRPSTERNEQLTLLKAMVSEANADQTISAPSKAQCRLYLLYAAGFFVESQLSEQIGLFRMRADIQLDWIQVSRSGIRQGLDSVQHWLRQMNAEVAQTAKLRVPHLVAEALRVRLVVTAALLHTQKFAAERFGVGASPSKDQLSLLRSDATATIAHFKQAKNLERELAVKMTLAEACEVLDEIEEARRLAKEVEAIADAMGYGRHSDAAKALLAGRSTYQALRSDLQNSDAQDDDAKWAHMPDEFIDEFANKTLEIAKLPVERRENIRRDIQNMRLVALERLSWCRSVQLLQDLFHTRSRETNYAVPCRYVGKCHKHGYESITSNPDAIEALDRFKVVFSRPSHLGCSALVRVARLVLIV
jgi:hypothetical protein